MSALVEASRLVQAIGSGEGPVGKQRRRAWVALAKLSTDFTWNRVCDLHRAEPRARVSGDELNVLRLAARQRREAIAGETGRESDELREARERELRELRDRVARIERLLQVVDPAFHGPQLDALRATCGDKGAA